MDRFVHLHVHSEYSLLDGACRIKDLIEKVQSMGQKAIAITDHGTMYGVINFYKEAKKAGIKPIIGCEVYVAPRRLSDKTKELDYDNSHLVLLCENEQGYKNLIKIVSKSFLEGFYFKPRIDIDLLREHSEGLIGLSACLSGGISKYLLKNDYTGAKEIALKYKEVLGENNFYIEIQDHGLKEERIVNSNLIKISKETGIPIVCTNDCHYIDKSDSYVHDILLCIQTNKTINDTNRMNFSSNEFYLKSGKEMSEIFSSIPEAIENTVKISDRCNLEFEFGNIKLPHFEVPEKEDHFEYFTKKCFKGLYQRYGENPDKKIIDRLEYELDVIKEMGYVDYYLIVNDFVSYAKDNDIPVGPGRGSGAGSLAAFCIGITDIDPIRYNLIFERFLNPERVSMPDFDIDFCYERRNEVIEYVINKYGADHVAQIVTFGTLAARGAIRDVGRVMGIPYRDVDRVARLIPQDIGITIDKALSNNKELMNIYSSNDIFKKLIDTAKKVEGMPRHASMHAAGVVITKDPVDHYVPLSKNDESVVTQYVMTTLEELGLLKIDFLGLRTLTVLDDTIKMVNKNNININKIDYDDDKVFEMISQGKTKGVFQFESEGMRKILIKLKPGSIEDLIAVISLYRPGPMDSIPTYIKNRHNPNNIKYDHELLEDILKVTYGCIIYQEQVLQIFRTLAGYSLGRADIVRRAMSKKKLDVMKREQEIFINGLVDDEGNIIIDGCIRRGIPEEVAINIYSKIESFAQYAFNKSHGASYAILSYRTAWMKYYYPKEFMASLLTSVIDNNLKLISYISVCNEMGIKILPPDINESELCFTVDKGKIRFGLLGIKNLGKTNLNNIIKERKKNGRYESLYDFCNRIKEDKFISKKIIESLIRSGALDDLGNNRREMMESYEDILNMLYIEKRNRIQGQISFFSTESNNKIQYNIKRVEEYSKEDLLAMEKDTMGVYVSDHPLSKYKDIIELINAIKITDIRNMSGEATIVGIITHVNIKLTKNNNMMAVIDIEDMSGLAKSILVFPEIFQQYSYEIREGNIVIIKVEIVQDETVKIFCKKVESIKNNLDKLKKIKKIKKGLYIRLDSENSKEYNKLKKLIDIFEGDFPIYIFFKDKGKLFLVPRENYIEINNFVIKELKELLGEDNIHIEK